MKRKHLNIARAALLSAAAMCLSAPLAQAQSNEKIIIGVNAEPTHFQPWDTAINNFPFFAQFYNVLVRKNEETQKPEPELAESWSFSNGDTVMTLKLREGVMFHSGREFVAEDVKKSLARALHPDVHANLKPMAATVKEVRVVDPHTVELELNSPNPAIFDLLDMLYMVDDDQFDLHRKQPIGTGPYVLAEHAPGQSLTLRPFKDYWRKPGATIQEVEYRIVPDPQAALLNLESNTVHAISNFPSRNAERLESMGLTVDVASTGIFYNFLFNAKDERFSNPALRRAFTHAVNRNRFVRIALGGQGKPLCMPWVSESNIAFDAELEASCEFDLEKAKKLLADAGYPNGLDVELVTSTQWFYGMTKLAEIMQNDFGQIGINVTLRNTETAEYVKLHNNLGFEMIMSLTGRAVRDPAAMLGMTSTWRPVNNTSNFESEDYVRLTTAAASTLDEAKRREIYGELNELIREQQFTIPVATAPTLFAYNSKIKGIRYSLEGFLTLEYASVE